MTKKSRTTKLSKILDGSFIKFSICCGGFARRRADVIEKGRPEKATFSLSACLRRAHHVSDELWTAGSPARGRILLNVSPDIQLILKSSAWRSRRVSIKALPIKDSCSEIAVAFAIRSARLGGTGRAMRLCAR